MKSGKLNLFVSLVLVLLLSSPAQSQFVKTLGGSDMDKGGSVIPVSDGGFVVRATTSSFGAGDYDVLLAKFDALGNHLWTRTLGGTSAEWAYSVIEASDEGLVVTGFTASFGAGDWDALLARFDSCGNHLWTRTLGGTYADDGLSVIEASDGGLVITGRTQSFGAGELDLLLAKFDSSGNHLWTRSLGGSEDDQGWSVVEASDGGLLVTGFTGSFGAGDYDVLLAKFDALGNHLWTRTLGGPGSDEGYSMIQASDGGLVVTGRTASFGEGLFDLLLAKFDDSGNHLWTRTLGGTDGDYAWFVIESSDGGLVVSGNTISFGAGSHDLLLAKFDSSGNHLWTRILGGTSLDASGSVIEASDGGLVMAGGTQSFGVGFEDLLLARFDASGITCLGEFITPTVTSPDPTIISPEPAITSPDPTITSPDPTITTPDPTLTTVCDVRPWIISISDVGNDQGRQVRVKWHCCYYDNVGLADTVTEYGIWRRVDQYKSNFFGQNVVIREVESLDQMLENVASTNYGDRYLVTKTGDLWDFIATVPAMQFSEYSYVAPTLADSTYEDGMYWSVFFVSAMTSDPLVHYDSEPDSGYSLDNIPPLPILDLEIDPNSWFTLQWTVPGEYPEERPISAYDIRYSTVPVGADTQTWWDNAVACIGEGFFNFIVGERDSLRAAEQTSCHPQGYFAIKGLDERPNASGISNIVRFLCGDASSDGNVDVGDVGYLINYLFLGTSPPRPMAAGDATCDGNVDIADVMYLINYLFTGTSPPCTP